MYDVALKGNTNFINYNSNVFVNAPYFDGLTHRSREADGLPWWSPSQVLVTNTTEPVPVYNNVTRENTALFKLDSTLRYFAEFSLKSHSILKSSTNPHF